jgi:hypothetical protein
MRTYKCNQTRLLIDADAKFLESREYRNITIQPPKPTLFEKIRAAVAYTVVTVGVGVAVFYVAPAHAAGSMAQDVRIIHVSPSVVQYGSKTERQIQVDNNKAQNQLNLEQLKFEHSRQLNADKAYYEKLKDQRKHK